MIYVIVALFVLCVVALHVFFVFKNKYFGPTFRYNRSLHLKGGALKKIPFVWNDAARKLLLECAQQCRNENLSPFKTNLFRLFKAAAVEQLHINKNANLTVSSVFNQLQITEKSSNQAPVVLKNVKWNSDNVQILLNCGFKTLSMCDRNKSLSFPQTLLTEFKKSFPNFDGTAYYLSERFHKESRKLTEADAQNQLMIADNAIVQAELESVVPTDNMPADLRQLRRFHRLGVEHGLKPLFKAVCSRCGKLAFGDFLKSQRFHLETINEDEGLLIERYYENLAPNLIPYTKDGKAIVCRPCYRVRDVFKHYSFRTPVTDKITRPDFLCNVSQSVESRVALLYVSTQVHLRAQPNRRIFLHNVGECAVLSKREEYLAEMLTIMAESRAADEARQTRTSAQQKQVRQILQYFREHNFLYRTFYANAETILDYVNAKRNPQLVNAPDQFETEAGEGLDTELGEEPVALFIQADDIDDEVVAALGADIPLAVTHPKSDPPATEPKKPAYLEKKKGLRSSHVEASICPTLFPNGGGSFKPFWETSLDGHRQLRHSDYLKMLALNLCARFRRHPYILFHGIDRAIKMNILLHNRSVVGNVSKLRISQPTVADLQKQRPLPVTAPPQTAAITDEQATVDPYAKYGKKVPASVPGSKTYWWCQRQNLYAICKSMERRPDFFITITANDNWSEIQRVIKHGVDEPNCPECPHLVNESYGASAVNHATECSIAFHERWRLWKQQCLFQPGPFGKVVRYWFRREYQKRGAVHLHGVIWVEQGTKNENAVSAEIPRLDNMPSRTAEDIEFIQQARELVYRFQMHRHREENCFKNRKNKLCRYGFPAPLLNEKREDASGLRMQYVRRDPADQYVVPYNLESLLLLDCHINVQEVTSKGYVIYLTKYMSKPEPSAKIGRRSNIKRNEQVKRYLTMRVVGAIEINDHILNFSAVDCNFTVVYLPVELSPVRKVIKRLIHLPSDPESTDVYYDSKIEKYLDRPVELALVTYPEFYRLYTYVPNKQSLNHNAESSDDNSDDEQDANGVVNAALPERTVNYYLDTHSRRVYKRIKPIVIRFPFLLPYGSEQEKFCLRLLLENVPITRSSLDSVISPQNKSGSYLEECVIRELWNEHEVSLNFLQEASKSGCEDLQLREMAAQLIKCNYLSKDEVATLLKDFHDQNMFAEFPEAIITAEGGLIGDADDFFSKFPTDMMELQPLEEYIANFTPDQRAVFEYIRTQAEAEQQILASVVGSAGTGKTYLIHALCALFSDKRYKATYSSFNVIAPTGCAAYLIKGTTLHCVLRLDNDLKCHIQKNSLQEFFLKYCDRWIIDEQSMISEEIFDIFRTLLHRYALLHQKFKLFADKDVIMFGDPSQLPSYDMPFFASNYFQRFKPFVLRTLVRQQNDEPFIRALQEVRMASCSPETIRLLSTRLDTKIDYARVLRDYTTIIVSKRSTCTLVNNEFLEKVDGQVYVFLAQDACVDGSALTEQQRLHFRALKNLLPARLHLKVGALVILRRNLNTTAGYVNGRRAIVDSIQDQSIILRSLTSEERWPVYRFKQLVKTFGEHSFYRMQFPLELAYAITVHRIQGQTLDKAIVKLDDTFFASGQAYVALSRVRKLEDMQLIAFDTTKIMLDPYYRQLLAWYDSHDTISPTAPKTKFPVWVVEAEREKAAKRSYSDYESNDDDDGAIPLEVQKNKKLKSKNNATAVASSSSPVPVAVTTSAPVHHFDERIELSNACDRTLKDMLFKTVYSSDNMLALQAYLAEHETLCDNVMQLLRTTPIQICSDSYPNLNPSTRITQIIEKVHCRSIVGDGNCFYRAISMCLFGNQDCAPLLRFAAVVSIARHERYFREYSHRRGDSILSVLLSAGTVTNCEHITRQLYSEVDLELNFTYADQLQQAAVAFAIRKPIFIYNITERSTNLNISQWNADIDFTNAVFVKLQHSHFEALIPLENNIAQYITFDNCIQYNTYRSLTDNTPIYPTDVE